MSMPFLPDEFVRIRMVSQASQLPYILWLFTKSDAFTFVLPNTIFGIIGALSGLLTNTTPNDHDTIRIVRRLPQVIVFNWLNVLVFDIANQRLPAAIAEDLINKPGRPLPSKRISPAAAQTLLLITIPIVFLATHKLGTGSESALLIALTWTYNDLGGGDSYITRNIIIACAFALYNAGSLKLAIGDELSISSSGLEWIAMISGVILTTMHVQDLKDQAGDHQRGRQTVPLALGNTAARWTLVVSLIFWSIVGPHYWRLGLRAYVLSGSMATVVVVRMLRWRDAKADSMTWKLWALWAVTLYSLPLLKRLG